MQVDGFAVATATPVRRLPNVDLEPLVELVRRQVQAEVSAERVRATMQRLLEEHYAEARVTAYLPILLVRTAAETLRRDLMQAAGGARDVV
jgi:PHP family Zn ribbon phosphoesterase